MEARLHPRRLLVCAAALVLLAVLTSGCGGGAAAQAAARTKEPPLVRYSSSFLGFSHPAAWKAYASRPSGLHFNPLVYLSTQPVHDPCSTQGKTTTCGFPVDRLKPGGVLVSWLYNGLPAAGLGPGKRIEVDGRPARIVETTGGICRRIGANRTIDVLVAVQPLPSALVEFTACLRGPGLAQDEHDVTALLASARFSH